MKLSPQIFLGLVSLTMLSNSPNAFAEWIQAGKSVEAITSYDAKSIQQNNGRAKIWVLTNFLKPVEIEGRKYQSSKTRFEYDCAGETSRVDGTFFYALTDGKGEVIAAEPADNKWYPIAPQSIAVPLWKIACGR